MIELTHSLQNIQELQITVQSGAIHSLCMHCKICVEELKHRKCPTMMYVADGLPFSLEGGHNVTVAKVLVVIQMQGVGARLGRPSSAETGAVEAKIKVLGKRHIPGVCTDGHHRSNL